MKLSNLYAYLISGLTDPEWEAISVPVGHGLYATLFEDRESEAGIVHTTVTPDQLWDAPLTPDKAHRVALPNLVQFADEDHSLSIQVLGTRGDPVNFLLYWDHPRVAACLRLPALYEHAAELLETAELVACVPQRGSLVHLPKRDRAYRQMLVGKLREIEADTPRPLSFELFEVSPSGVRPFVEPA